MILGVDVSSKRIACVLLEDSGSRPLVRVRTLPPDFVNGPRNAWDFAIGLARVNISVFVESPPLVRGNPATHARLHQVLGGFLAGCHWTREVVLVSPGEWKKGCGLGLAGNATKVDVRLAVMKADDYLLWDAMMPHEGDQDVMDAACIALYGASVLASRQSAA